MKSSLDAVGGSGKLSTLSGVCSVITTSCSPTESAPPSRHCDPVSSVESLAWTEDCLDDKNIEIARGSALREVGIDGEESISMRCTSEVASDSTVRCLFLFVRIDRREGPGTAISSMRSSVSIISGLEDVGRTKALSDKTDSSVNSAFPVHPVCLDFTAGTSLSLRDPAPVFPLSKPSIHDRYALLEVR